MENTIKTGTTTVGIIFKDAVILAADRRATAGGMVVSRDTEKVAKINDSMAVTTAGSVSDIQLTTKYLKAEINIKEVRTGRRPTVKEAANMLAGMNYYNIRTMGSIGQFLFAGYDNAGAHLYMVAPDGSLIDYTTSGFAVTGSGTEFALGVLEDNWKKDMNEQEAVDLAARAVAAAIKRDVASGEGVDIYVIDKKGLRKAAQKLVSHEFK